MLNKMFNTRFSSKVAFMAVAMMFCFVTASYGRDGLKLYSVGNNNPAWNSTSSWSLTANGAPATFVPQSNDTVIIDRAVIQNVDFTFSGKGVLEVSSTGILRGDNVSLGFSGSSALKCNGEIKINNLNVNENATFNVEPTGNVLVKNSCVNKSASNHIVLGKLTVTGSLSVDSKSNIEGNGTIVAAQYNGSGSVLGVVHASSIPDGSLISEYNWTGAIDNNWNEAGNWAGGHVPTATSNIAVLSSTHNPEVTEKAFTDNVYINSGSSLIVNPDATININGNISVIGVGKLLLKNTIAKKSNLFLDGDATGNIQSEYQVLKGQKNLVSSPFEMAFSQTFLNMYLRTYNESSSQWGEYIVPTNNPMQVMQGYELYSLSSETRTFEGIPDQGPKSYVISNSGDGLNLTGNPYPCFIDWENNDNNAWARNSIASAIYYPDPSGSGNFSVYLPGDDAVSLNNGSRYIAPMQGFFVKAASEGSLVVTKNSRVSSFNESKHTVKNNSIKFKLNNNAGATDEVMFRVLDNSTYGFDNTMDALKLQNDTDAPSLFFESDGDDKYAINTIPAISSSISIPLNIESKKEGQFSISVSGALNFEYRYPVVLEDKELNKFIDLRTDSVYTFNQTPEMNSKRFAIHFYSTQGVEETQAEEISGVTVNQGQVTVTGVSNSVNNEIYTANLFSMDGKLISTSKGSLTEGINLSTGNHAAGVCILQLSDGKHIITKKIITK